MSEKTVVFTAGCFDLFHPGHLHLLRTARMQGHRLIVGLNSDDSVRRLKGPGRPFFSDSARADLLRSLVYVSRVDIFDEDTPERLVEEWRPDVIVKGADYSPEQVPEARSVLARGGRLVIVPLLKGHSTTEILRRLRWAAR